jgi:hypothetical protein
MYTTRVKGTCSHAMIIMGQIMMPVMVTQIMGCCLDSCKQALANLQPVPALSCHTPAWVWLPKRLLGLV